MAINLFTLVIILLSQTAVFSFASNLVCSKANSVSPIELLNVDNFPTGEILLSHDDNSSRNGLLYNGKLPVECAWKLTLNDSKVWAIELDFIEFELPDDDGSSIDQQEQCAKNYVKIFWLDEFDPNAEQILDMTLCSSGSVPRYLANQGRSILIKVHIEDPFKGFKIKFSRSRRDSLARSNAISCSVSTHFLCPENNQICLPRSYKCDGIVDCPNGGDEGEDCPESNYNQKTASSGCASNRYLKGDHGSITSLNYPCNYTNNLRCRWNIKTPQGSKILLAFNEIFDIENGPSGSPITDCPFDSLTVFSRSDNTLESMEFVAKICGNKPKPYIIPTNEIEVTFETDNHDTASGFRMHWVTIEDDKIDTFLGEDRAFRVKAIASETQKRKLKRYPGGTACKSSKPVSILGLEGVVNSLNYGPGEKYPNRVTCHWRFEPTIPDGKKFKHFEFHFNDFDVPSRAKCEKAGVRLKYIFNEQKKQGIRYTFCNSERPPTEKSIVMTAPVVEIEFKSNVLPGNQGRGFEFEFKVVLEGTVSPSTDRNVTEPSPSPPPGNCGVAYDVRRSATAVPADGGDTSSMTRIVGGNPAKPGRWRWPVHLVFGDDEVACGGAVIFPRWIVTAAHCFGASDHRNHQSKGWQIFIGRHGIYDKTAWNGGGIIQPKIDSIFVHGSYSFEKNNKLYDIALIKLKQKLPIGESDLVKPICLPDSEVQPNKRCTVLGWGDTKGTGGEGILKEAEMPVMDGDLCKSMNKLYKKSVNTQQMLCVGYPEGKVDACQGDSGGPLACESNGKWYLQGIVSWGRGCAGARAPGIYTKVFNFLDWIAYIVNNQSQQ